MHVTDYVQGTLRGVMNDDSAIEVLYQFWSKELKEFLPDNPPVGFFQSLPLVRFASLNIYRENLAKVLLMIHEMVHRRWVCSTDYGPGRSRRLSINSNFFANEYLLMISQLALLPWFCCREPSEGLLRENPQRVYAKGPNSLDYDIKTLHLRPLSDQRR